jgi:lipid A 3-O-deacylase
MLSELVTFSGNRVSSRWLQANAAFSLAVFALAGFSPLAHGEGPADSVSGCNLPSAYQSAASWSISDENDVFGVTKNKTDDFYTQGFRLTREFETKSDDSPYNGLRDWIEPLSKFACRHRLRVPGLDRGSPLYRGVSLSIGQNIYTPVDITIKQPILDDRPYAGWLYLDLQLNTVELPVHWLMLDHTTEIQAGIVGPPAQGEWVQTHFHKWIGDHLPQGWAHQLPTEPGLLLLYRLDARTQSVGTALQLDTVTHGEVSLGNVQTYGEAGIQVRLGRNVGAPFGVFRASAENPRAADEWWLPADNSRPCLAGPWIFAIRECTVGIGIQERAVARNIFLDGTWFSRSQHVDHEPFVYDILAGFRLRWRYAQLDATFVRRSQEFSPLPSDAQSASGVHNYGAINVRCLEAAGWVCPATTLFLLAGLIAH